MTSIPLTSRSTSLDVNGTRFACESSSPGPEGALPSLSAGGERSGAGAILSVADLGRVAAQVWQSAVLLRWIFFSLMYLSAAVFTIGLMICSSACMKSLLIAHFEPSHVWMRAHVDPMWSAHEVEMGRSTPAKPSPSSRFWS